MKEKLITFSKTVWFFPAIIVLIVLGLAAFKISGSSVGMYNQFLYGTSYNDPNLLYGQPRPIRSDEWLVVTPTAVAQTQNGLRAQNNNIGHGEDLSVVIDTPHNNWVALFQPQNWPFFVLPVEYAFALKWWLLLAALIISCYFFVLTLMPRQKWFAILVALGLAFAPYVQWWYQSITILSLAYGFIIATLLLKVLHTRPKKQRLWWAAGLSYCLAAFAFLQYPPFLLPVALGVAAFFGGHVLDHWHVVKRHLKASALAVAGPVAAALGAIGLFWATHTHVLHLVANTAYPGQRAAETMHLTIWELLGGFLMASLQNTAAALHYFSNQSEASNFIMLAPFLLMPSAYITYRAFKRGLAHKYTLLFLNIVLAGLILRFLVTVEGNGLASLLRVVPNNRVLLGIGFVAVLQLIVLAREQQQVKYPKRLVKWMTIVTALGLLYVGWRLKRDYPGFIDNSRLILLLAATMSAAFYLFIQKRIVAAALLLFGLAFFATYKVNPLYRGLSPLINSPLSQEIKKVNKEHKGGAWIVLDSLEFNTYVSAQGIRSISGVYEYPQFGLWHKLDPHHTYTTAYNRYAQAVFSEYAPDKIYLVQNDMFHIKFDGCAPFVQKEARFVLSVHPANASCLHLISTLALPGKTFYIYKTGH